MKILSKKRWNKLQDLVVGLQQDLNYTREQLEISEKQVTYLQNEIRRANDIKKPVLKSETTKTKKKLQTLENITNLTPPKRGRKKKEVKENEQKATTKKK